MTTNERKYQYYSAGSYISILPQSSENTINLVESIIEIEEKFIKIDKSNNFEIYSNINEKYPHFCKFIEKKFLGHLEIFEFFVDFTGVLKRSQMNNIKFLLEKKIKNFDLLKSYEILFANYSQFIAKNKICLLDFLKSLKKENQKLQLSITEIFEFFPMKYPRNYSLISNPILDNNNLEIVFTLVKEKIQRNFSGNFKNNNFTYIPFEENEVEYFGQCTSFLNSIEESDKLIVTDIKNNFIFPLNCLLEKSKPIIYFCNGTGITPCISFLKQIKYSILNLSNLKNEDYDYSSSSPLDKVGKFVIFTGFRNAENDKKETIYEDFILETVDCLNEKIGRNSVIYNRCLSNIEGK
jgi:sulfite reductase alpha subunit-like flavoprotein